MAVIFFLIITMSVCRGPVVLMSLLTIFSTLVRGGLGINTSPPLCCNAIVFIQQKIFPKKQ